MALYERFEARAWKSVAEFASERGISPSVIGVAISINNVMARLVVNLDRGAMPSTSFRVRLVVIVYQLPTMTDHILPD